MKKRVLFLGIGAMLVLYSCTGMNRMLTTDLSPVPFQPNDGYKYFEFKTSADPTYPEDSDWANRERITYLREWLNINGYSDEYQILRREPIKARDAVLGADYRIYYLVRVKDKRK